MQSVLIGWRSAFVALVVCMAATWAQATPRAAGEHRDDTSRQLIEKSVLIAPGNIGEFTLDGSSYDPTNKQAGAGFRYSLGGHQEIRFDVYVYPAGRMSEADALVKGMAEFKTSFRGAEKAGIYHDLVVGDEGDFQLEPADEATPVDGSSVAPLQDDKAEESRLIRALIEGSRHAGRRVRLSMQYPPLDTPLYSDGYLFYKQLYFFKVRASAARDRIDESAFHALADSAASTLVPAIQVANIGGCAQAVITLDSNVTADAMARALVAQSAAAEDENCYLDEASADIASKSTGASTVEITFDPGDWNGK